MLECQAFQSAPRGDIAGEKVCSASRNRHASENGGSENAEGRGVVSKCRKIKQHLRTRESVWHMASLWDMGARSMLAPCGRTAATYSLIKGIVRQGAAALPSLPETIVCSKMYQHIFMGKFVLVL